MNRNIKKETIVATIAFIISVLGFKLTGLGLEVFGKFLMLISILTGIVFIAIGNLKFWFGNKNPHYPEEKRRKNDDN
ncbi:hypothetical protein [Halomonas llamarensis]|uniref:Uncharacterized protein n=1 Tax=Halomonas llamarensis TaxID=2945104 RepID=A0ABT0SS60_9GAMM|nr:hypothetical protein [Halomonas llamarensis]MCL7930674.1 hypothetical protein [Halomonas llamarensis]